MMNAPARRPEQPMDMLGSTTWGVRKVRIVLQRFNICVSVCVYLKRMLFCYLFFVIGRIFVVIVARRGRE